MSEHLSARCSTERGSTRLHVRPLSYLRGEQRQRVAVRPERQFRGPAKNTIKGMSDMKKIKTKLVTFVTDNVRLIGIVGHKDLLARMSQEKEP